MHNSRMASYNNSHIQASIPRILALRFLHVSVLSSFHIEEFHWTVVCPKLPQEVTQMDNHTSAFTPKQN